MIEAGIQTGQSAPENTGDPFSTGAGPAEQQGRGADFSSPTRVSGAKTALSDRFVLLDVMYETLL